MYRVLYFNITYKCNSKCTFCFSNSTNENGNVLSSTSIARMLCSFSPDKNDLIVLNGGEPTTHPEFYKLLAHIQNNLPSKIAVYSNGLMIDKDRLKSAINTHFVIPIHGPETVHNSITQVNGHYAKVLSNLRHFDNNGIRYRVKFIINEKIVATSYDIASFLLENKLKPEEIILARLNRTKKSECNKVVLPEKAKTIAYLSKQIRNLKHLFAIKLIDYPFCYFNDGYVIMNDYDAVPKFFFADPNTLLQPRVYYKDIMLGPNCEKCEYYSKCDQLRKTYLTPTLKNDVIHIELE